MSTDVILTALKLPNSSGLQEARKRVSSRQKSRRWRQSKSVALQLFIFKTTYLAILGSKI